MNKQGKQTWKDHSSSRANNNSWNFEDIYKRAPGFGSPVTQKPSGNPKQPRDWKTILAVIGVCLFLLFLLGILGCTAYGWFLHLPTPSEETSKEMDEEGKEIENQEEEMQKPETPAQEETLEEEKKHEEESLSEDESAKEGEPEKQEIDTSLYIAGQIDAGTYKEHSYAIYHLDRLPRAIESYGELSSYLKKWDAHLLTIDDADENHTIFRFLMENYLGTAFFGYSDETQEGVWLWDDGSRGGYTNWSEYNEQPNNGKFNEKEKWKNEDYAEFMLETNDGSWNDAPFGINTRYFIVEWDKFDPSLKPLE